MTGNAGHFGLSERANLPALAEFLQLHPTGVNRTTSRVDPGRRILPMGPVAQQPRLLPKWSKDIVDLPRNGLDPIRDPIRAPVGPVDLLAARQQAVARALSMMMMAPGNRAGQGMM